MVTRIINARLITPIRIVENAEIAFENGKITYVGPGRNCLTSDATFDVEGRYVSPGFIDCHTHGGGGHDFMDGSVEAFLEPCRTHARFGTTSIIATTLASDLEELYQIFKLFQEAKVEKYDGANLLGLHLEGPYFSYGQRGAQDPRYLKNPERQEYMRILDDCEGILRWSLAPELEGALEMARELRGRGILPSIAHSDAVYQQVAEAFENGFTHLTHFYSGMSTLVRKNSYRYLGVIESGYLMDEMTVEIIADGAHLPAELLQLIYKSKGSDKIALVTDSMRGAGMPEGPSVLGSLRRGQEVVVEDGVAKLLDRLAFAGSVATADRLVRNMVRLAGVPVWEAVKMMTLTPARIHNLRNKGMLSVGYDADLVVFDEGIRVRQTFVKGRLVFEG